MYPVKYSKFYSNVERTFGIIIDSESKIGMNEFFKYFIFTLNRFCVNENEKEYKIKDSFLPNHPYILSIIFIIKLIISIK